MVMRPVAMPLHREVVELPAQTSAGSWSLNFENGLGFVCYGPDDDESESVYEEWTTTLWRHLVYKDGDVCEIRSKCGATWGIKTFRSAHEELQVGWKPLGSTEFVAVPVFLVQQRFWA